MASKVLTQPSTRMLPLPLLQRPPIRKRIHIPLILHALSIQNIRIDPMLPLRVGNTSPTRILTHGRTRRASESPVQMAEREDILHSILAVIMRGLKSLGRLTSFLKGRVVAGSGSHYADIDESILRGCEDDGASTFERVERWPAHAFADGDAGYHVRRDIRSSVSR